MQTFTRLNDANQEAEQRAQRESEKRQRQAEYQAKIAKYAEANEGFVETLMESQVSISDDVTEVVMGSEKAAELTHWLADNPAEAARINTLPPIEAARELGRIEAGFAIAKPKVASDAPSPQTDITGGDEAPAGLRDDMDIDEWMRRRNEQRLEKFGRL